MHPAVTGHDMRVAVEEDRSAGANGAVLEERKDAMYRTRSKSREVLNESQRATQRLRFNIATVHG